MMAKKHSETSAIARRGLMLVLSSPSGAGKTTLSRRLLDQDGGVTLSISVTTRKMRPGEQDGRDYHFIDQQRFDALIDKDELLEYAEVFDNYYGTPRKPVMDALAKGRDVLFDIDWQGAKSIADAAGPDTASVFILPPTMADLAARLRSRAQDADAVIARRLGRAKGEIEKWTAYDYVIVNDDFERAYGKLAAIYRAERLRRERNPWLATLVAILAGEAI
jgi:guanylate kinase